MRPSGSGLKRGRTFMPVDILSMDPASTGLTMGVSAPSGFTIIAPVNYYGQKKTEPFVFASVLLDGADTTLGGMDITGVPHSELRSGLRVKAKWKPREERSVEGMSNRGWGGFGDVVESFEVTGEPDADEEKFKEHLF